jgi:uncharacterized protein YjiK
MAGIHVLFQTCTTNTYRKICPMKLHKLFIVSIVLLTSIAHPAHAADAWPGSSTGTVIVDTTLDSGDGSEYEPSGLAWNDETDQLLMVGDDGDVTTMNLDGTNLVNHYIGSDFEGIAIIDPTTNRAYIGVEKPLDSIKEVNLTTGEVASKTWDLTPWMVSDDVNEGLEALTFVPNADLPTAYGTSTSGGMFYAGLQNDGKIYVFDVDITTTAVRHVATINPPTGIVRDIADLHYNTDTHILYGVYDENNTLVEFTTAGDILTTYQLPSESTDQEGLVVRPDCETGLAIVVIGEDSGFVRSYSDYPVTCNLPTPTEEEPADTPADDTAGDPTETPTVDTTSEVCDDSTPTTTPTEIPVTSTLAIAQIAKQKHSIVITYTDASTLSFQPFGKHAFAATLDQRGQRIIVTSGKRVRVYDNCGKLVAQHTIHKRRAARVAILLLPANHKSYRTIVVATSRGRLTSMRLTAQHHFKNIDRARITTSSHNTPRLQRGTNIRRFRLHLMDVTHWKIDKNGDLHRLS